MEKKTNLNIHGNTRLFDKITNIDCLKKLNSENKFRPLQLQISNEDGKNAKLSLEDSDTNLDKIGMH